jgi:hypothetical protein
MKSPFLKAAIESSIESNFGEDIVEVTERKA